MKGYGHYMKNDHANTPASPNEKVNHETEQALDTIERSASVAVKNGEETIYCLSIIGQVEGHYVETATTTEIEKRRIGEVAVKNPVRSRMFIHSFIHSFTHS